MNAIDDFFLVPYVLSQRLPILWMETVGLAPDGRRESERMITEKVDAVTEGMVSAHAEMMKATFAMGSALMSGRSPFGAALKGVERTTQAALAPSGRKLRRNARRLSGRN